MIANGKDAMGHLSLSSITVRRIPMAISTRGPLVLTLPTAQAGELYREYWWGFLRGTDLRQLYSQGVSQKPPSHSLKVGSVVAFP